MRLSRRWALSALFCLVGALQARSAPPAAGEGTVPVRSPKMQKAVDLVAGDYQKTVEPLFQVSCFDCHSNATRYPWYHSIPGVGWWIDHDVREARGHLDMSEGFPFRGKGHMKNRLKAIAHLVDTGDMPPLDYRIMHRGSGLTPQQKQAVEDWVQRSLDRLENAED